MKILKILVIALLGLVLVIQVLIWGKTLPSNFWAVDLKSKWLLLRSLFTRGDGAEFQ